MPTPQKNFSPNYLVKPGYQCIIVCVQYNTYLIWIDFYHHGQFLNHITILFSRPKQSLGILYKHLRDYFINEFSESVNLFLPQLYGAATPKRLVI